MADDITPLLSDEHAPTRAERELFERAWTRLSNGEPVRASTLAGELVALGVATIERANLIVEAHFLPGGLPPLDKGGRPSLQWLIQRHAEAMPTGELLALIQRHHPTITIPEIVAELRRQAEANLAEADELRAYKIRPSGPSDVGTKC